MKRVFFLLIVVACAAAGWAQTASPPYQSTVPRTGAAPYQPAVPPPTTNVYGGGGWYGNSGGGTVAGSALNGMSQVISAAGQYNLATSAAAINMTQAQSNEMQNQVQAVNTFWETRNIGKAQRAADRGPPPTAEQIARMARMGMPSPLTPSQLDPVSGRLNWPDALQNPTFDAQRGELDQMFAKRASYGGLDYADRDQVSETIDSMVDELKARIRDIPPQAYTLSKSFLRSMLYASTGSDL
jgi:hypothetical protein